MKNFFRLIFILILAFVIYLFVGESKTNQNIVWGVNFSQKHAQNLGLDWKNTYSALLDDLGVKNLKVAAHWDLLEPEKDKYNFDDLDWQVAEAEKRGAKILLVIGMKTGRWPECHIPTWAQNLSKEDQQKEILEMIKEIVLKYKDSETLKYWQVENEPFFPFGACPWVDNNFLKQEIDLVKMLDDQKRPIIISDSGEGSFWIQAGKMGDIVGTTMYKRVWFTPLEIFNKIQKLTGLPNFFDVFGNPGFYIRYPFPPTFYARKAQLIKKFFGKEVICIELQAEPWGPTLLYDSSLQEQEKTMNLGQFRYNVEFAKKTGLKEFYLWGGEWWYWLKIKQNKPDIWNEAKKLFITSENL
jgi:hypothetical protein